MSYLAFPGSKVSRYLCCVCGFEVPLTPLLDAVLTFLVCIPSWMASLIFFRPFLSPSSEITLSLAESLLGDNGRRLNTHNSKNSTRNWKGWIYWWMWLDSKWLPRSCPQELHVLPVAAAALITILFLGDWPKYVGRFVWGDSRCTERQRHPAIKKQDKLDIGVCYGGCHLLVQYEMCFVEERRLWLILAPPVKQFNFGLWATSWNVF